MTTKKNRPVYAVFYAHSVSDRLCVSLEDANRLEAQRNLLLRTIRDLIATDRDEELMDEDFLKAEKICDEIQYGK